MLALLTDDEAAWCGACGAGSPSGGAGGAGTPAGPAPLRDLQLFGDCELAILAASREEYEAHAKLVRAEYAALTNKNYVELRIKVKGSLRVHVRIPYLKLSHRHTRSVDLIIRLGRRREDPRSE